jgi:BMFP domain-containing protein YqiC
MYSAKFLHEFSKQFSDSLPPPLKSLRQEFENQFYQGLSLVFEKMKLVSREEFDIQTELLARTRDKVEQLERKLVLLELDQESKGKNGTL